MAIKYLSSLLVTICQVVACTGPDPQNSPVHTDAPDVILMFSETAGFRHGDGISGANAFFAEVASKQGFDVVLSEDSAIFNADDLARFDVIVFNNVTGPALNPEEKQAFETWLTGGGGWIGLHGSGSSTGAFWDWYRNTLLGTDFIGHIMAPQFQEARLVSLAPTHPVMRGIPRDWQHTDEWYSFSQVPDMPNTTLLVGIDEASYSPTNTVVKRWPEDLRMGSDPAQHPVIWATCGVSYRAVYSSIGHAPQSYDDPHYRDLLENAVDWVSGSQPGPSACED